ncbi:MAG TPA: plasmid pRiA4b ORF-3 family protein [Thermomicrobiales bacterium]|nr:plasmid pRiA4b ORF-3 family protein [Thermomicrobiales bacterium]
MAPQPKKDAPPESIHQLKVTLNGLEPPIWRRIQMASDITMEDLHVVLQIAMGWEFEHLHQFSAKRQYIGDASMLDDVRDQSTTHLREVAPRKGSKFQYEYDMGDSWEHDIVGEAIQPPEPGAAYPVVLMGERACPPEDCGGVWDYADLIEIMADPKHESYEEMLDWPGGPLDPEKFDLAKVNKKLQPRRGRSRRAAG